MRTPRFEVLGDACEDVPVTRFFLKQVGSTIQLRCTNGRKSGDGLGYGKVLTIHADGSLARHGGIDCKYGLGDRLYEE